jgi:hypothetical protein
VKSCQFQIPDPEDRAEIMFLMMDIPEAELSPPASDPFTKSIFLVFLAVGVLLLVISALTGANAVLAISREASAEGHVVDLVTRRDENGNEFYYPIVEFVLPDGSLKTVQLSEGSWPPAYEKGQAVTVLYDSQRPIDARIKSTSSTLGIWTWSLITGSLGVIFVIVSLFVRWLFKIESGPPKV